MVRLLDNKLLSSRNTLTLTSLFSKATSNETSFLDQTIDLGTSNLKYTAFLYCPFLRSNATINFNILVSSQKVTPSVERVFFDNIVDFNKKSVISNWYTYSFGSGGYLYFGSNKFYETTVIQISSASISQLAVVIEYYDIDNRFQSICKLKSNARWRACHHQRHGNLEHNDIQPNHSVDLSDNQCLFES